MRRKGQFLTAKNKFTIVGIKLRVKLVYHLTDQTTSELRIVKLIRSWTQVNSLVITRKRKDLTATN